MMTVKEWFTRRYTRKMQTKREQGEHSLTSDRTQGKKIEWNKSEYF